MAGFFSPSAHEIRPVRRSIDPARDRDRNPVAAAVEGCPIRIRSTDSGDAWMLDPEDRFALCLARDGTPAPEPVPIVETETSFAIDWHYQYRMDQRLFTVINLQSGRATTITGYPTQQILAAIAQFGQGPQPG
jgi:hypothetical protein